MRLERIAKSQGRADNMLVSFEEAAETRVFIQAGPWLCAHQHRGPDGLTLASDGCYDCERKDKTLICQDCEEMNRIKLNRFRDCVVILVRLACGLGSVGVIDKDMPKQVMFDTAAHACVSKYTFYSSSIDEGGTNVDGPGTARLFKIWRMTNFGVELASRM